jgi:hypothetical protein
VIKAKATLRNNSLTPQGFTTGVFVMNLFYTGFNFFAAALYWVHRPVHYGQIARNLCKDPTHLHNLWHDDKTILGVCIFLAVITSLGFLIVTECAWFSCKLKSQVSKAMIGLVGCMICIFGGIALLYVEVSLNLIDTASLYGKMESEYITFAKVSIWVLIGLVIINLMLNVLKKTMLTIPIVVLYVLLILMIVTCGGLTMRKTQQLQEKTLIPTCYRMLNDAKDDQMRNFCPKKYIESSDACSKAQLGVWWEKNPISPTGRNMNPTCCHPAINFYTYDIMMAGAMMYFVAIFTGMMILFNIHLIERVSDEESADAGKNTMSMTLFIVAVLIVLVLAITQFWFRDWYNVKQSPQSIEYLKSKKSSSAWENYKPVPSSLSAPSP